MIAKKRLFKILMLTLLLVLATAGAFFYRLIAESGEIFQGNGTTKVSFAKQLSEMVINPTQSLNGEENGQVNILLLGCGGEGHSGGALTDTIMILSLKPRTHEAALLSIPRDLYVEVGGTDIRSKINAVKELGDKRPEKDGQELLERTIEEVSALRIDYFVQLDFKGFVQIIDSVGGIDVYLEKEIDDPAYPDFNHGYDPFYIEAGWHHLDGATALKVARSRHSTMGDFDRIKRQQEIIKAFRAKIYEKYSNADLGAFTDMLSALSSNLKTDIEPKDLPRFYQVVKEIKNHNFSAQTVDTQSYLQKINVGLGYTLAPRSGDYSATNQLGESLFDLQIPEAKKAAIRDENALIAIQNGTGSPDIANTIARDLEDMGFRIVSTSNIDAPDSSCVTIYHEADTAKPETLAFLKEKFSAKDEAEGKKEGSRADFTIVLGAGF